MLKDASRAYEEQIIALKQQLEQVVNTTEETYANTVQVTSGKKKTKK